MSVDDLINHHWAAVENDFQDNNLDLADPVIKGRSWRWFRTRLEGFASRPIGVSLGGTPIYASRIQQIVNDPDTAGATGVAAEGGAV